MRRVGHPPKHEHEQRWAKYVKPAKPGGSSWSPATDEDPAPSGQPMRICDAKGRELSLDALAKLITKPPIPTKADLRKQILFNQRHGHVVRDRRLRAKITAETAQMQEALHRRSAPSEARPRQQGRREARPAARRGGAVRSRDRPRQSDDDEPADHVVRLRLTPELRAFLKAEVDRLVRQGLADQQVVVRALFRAVEAWGEAGVVG